MRANRTYWAGTRMNGAISCHCVLIQGKYENICVLKTYLIVLRPIFGTAYKGGNRSKNACELYITNWSYYYKIGIVFAVYQKIR